MRRAFNKAIHRICGHVEGKFRIRTADGDLMIDRRQPLPVLALAQAAGADGPFALDPRITAGGAHLALWTYAPSYRNALDQLTDPLLHPQLAIVTPAGTALVWVPDVPYDAPADPARPDVGTLLGAIAAALSTIPPGPDDGIPLPRADEDLVAVCDDTHADPMALWAWAELVLADRRRQAALPAPGAEAATHAATSSDENGAEESAVSSLGDPWGVDQAEELEPAGRDGEGLATGGGPSEAQESSFLADRRRGARDGLPAREGQSSSPAEAAKARWSASNLECGDDLDRLLKTLARHAGLSADAMLARALVAHAMAALGTAEVYRLLDVRLTWLRPDGLFGWRDGEWRKIA